MLVLFQLGIRWRRKFWKQLLDTPILSVLSCDVASKVINLSACLSVRFALGTAQMDSGCGIISPIWRILIQMVPEQEETTWYANMMLTHICQTRFTNLSKCVRYLGRFHVWLSSEGFSSSCPFYLFIQSLWLDHIFVYFYWAVLF